MKPGENTLLTEIRNNSLNKISPSVTEPRADCPASDQGGVGWQRDWCWDEALTLLFPSPLSQQSTPWGLPQLPVWGGSSKLVILIYPCDGCWVYTFKSFSCQLQLLRTSGDTFGCSWSWHNFLWTQLLGFISSTKFFICRFFLFLYALCQGQM